jgi:2-polyprenyl-6-methoxyphenol hydroxylase-like FAD-dependent oxidoreductase
VVVGAGIGGLTASLVLSRVAARVTLVERAERPSEVGAALALNPNGMAVLDLLGLLPAVEALSARIDRMDIRSVTGRRLLTAEMPDLGGGLDHAIAVRRTDLHHLLLEAVNRRCLRRRAIRVRRDERRPERSGEDHLHRGEQPGPRLNEPAGRPHRGCRRSQIRPYAAWAASTAGCR